MQIHAIHFQPFHLIQVIELGHGWKLTAENIKRRKLNLLQRYADVPAYCTRLTILGNRNKM